jgi:hypothetical protein
MYGNARRAGVDTDVNGLEDAGNLPAARIAQRRNLVDVDGQLDHTLCYAL